MGISYDPEKNTRNIVSRGLSFDSAVDFAWSTALVVEDTRRVYAERRFQPLGYIGERLHMLVFTPREELVHIISLRKAHRREVQRYEA